MKINQTVNTQAEKETPIKTKSERVETQKEEEVISYPSSSEPTRSDSDVSFITDTEVHWRERVLALREMDYSTLTVEDHNYLYSLLINNPLNRERSDTWFVVVNEIMEQIRLNGISPEKITDAYLTILQDSSNHYVIRDYSIQHLSQWISPELPESLGESDDQKVFQALDSLTSIITDPSLGETSIPGTALISLVRASQAGLDISSSIDELNTWMKRSIKRDSTLDLPTRTTVINSIGELKLTQFYPTLQEYIHDPEADMSMRISSIAALGHIMKPIDISHLNSLASQEPRLKYAIKSAIDRHESQ